MASPYLDQPLIPLSVALTQILKQLEAKLADGALETSEEEGLRRRAVLIRDLLAPIDTP